MPCVSGEESRGAVADGCSAAEPSGRGGVAVVSREVDGGAGAVPDDVGGRVAFGLVLGDGDVVLGRSPLGVGVEPTMIPPAKAESAAGRFAVTVLWRIVMWSAPRIATPAPEIAGSPSGRASHTRLLLCSSVCFISQSEVSGPENMAPRQLS